MVNGTLTRDAATFTFASGTFYLLAPVNGKVTGAVFVGSGSLEVKPPTTMERNSLRLLTGGQDYKEDFDSAVFRFGDGTENDLRKLGSVGVPAGGTGSALSLLSESMDQTRTKVHYNLTARLLQDVLSPQPGGLFVAFIKGKRYSGQTWFVIDPHGAPNVEPEEVELLTYDTNKFGIWTAFHLAGEYAKGMAHGTQNNAFIDMDRHDLDTTIERSGRLEGKAKSTFFSNIDGLRVVMLDLFPSLRVSSVTGPNGEALSFIQEDKREDADFAVILPKPLAKNERYAITTSYAGKDAVNNGGNGNYFPLARDNWYPKTTFGDYAEYHLVFRIPKGLKMVASGTPVKQWVEGGQAVSEWTSEAPQVVPGFNFGAMRSEEAKLQAENYVVESYANDDLPDYMKLMQNRAINSGSQSIVDQDRVADNRAVGTMSTVSMMKHALGEAQASVQLYTDYFGPAPYKRVAITQQTACNFGGAWPGLVYLPLCSFFDDTTRHELFRTEVNQTQLISYFRVVGPHEVAHQWWGDTVGFNSYRDQWMSEGFAQFSASLFLQKYRNADYMKFMEEQRHLLLQPNNMGVRAIDSGPLVMGYRINNSKTGSPYTSLSYSKGMFVLHMIRMMFWDRKTGDQTFKEMMHDFTATYANRAASTEDFKAMVEKHLPDGLKFTTDGKLSWFFNEWVYGTALPTYRLEPSYETGANGEQVLNAKITQSNVDAAFLMPVPIYVELNDGRMVRVAQAPMVGNSTHDFKIPLTGLKEKPKRVLLNAYDDVLTGNP